jgi:translation initiation factor 1
MKSKPSTTLIYSTETGRICPIAACRWRSASARLTSGPWLRPAARRRTGCCGCSAQPKVRGGKSVTLVRGLALDAAALAALGKQLKAACGSGGTAKDGVIEVQGDHVATVMAALGKLGYAVKRSGG